MTPSVIAALAVAKEHLQDATVAQDRVLEEMQRAAAEMNKRFDDARIARARYEGEVRALEALTDPPAAVPLSEDALHGRG